MRASDWDEQAVTVKVVIGTFEVMTSLGSDIGKSFLTAEMARVSKCALKLANSFQIYIEEGDTDELRCQHEILSSLAHTVGQGPKT